MFWCRNFLHVFCWKSSHSKASVDFIGEQSNSCIHSCILSCILLLWPFGGAVQISACFRSFSPSLEDRNSLSASDCCSDINMYSIQIPEEGVYPHSLDFFFNQTRSVRLYPLHNQTMQQVLILLWNRRMVSSDKLDERRCVKGMWTFAWKLNVLF